MVLVPDESQLTALVANALRAHDSETASLLRMLKNALHNAEISQGSPLDMQARVALYRKETKQRRESAAIFAANSRPDSAAQEQHEAEYIESLLPALVSREQLLHAAQRILPTLSVQGQAAKGALIREMKTEFGSNADGKMIADIVSELL